jgi:hypothetical protein
MQQIGSLPPQELIIVLVHFGCCNRIPKTMGLMNNRNLYLTVLKAEKSKIKVPADSVSNEGSVFLLMAPSCCILTRRRGDLAL